MKRYQTFMLCALLLLLAFGFDLITPQALVAAILLTVPVALSSLLLNRRITTGFVIAALVADVIAGWYNGMREGHHWDAIAVGNRTLAAFSIILVALLGALAQRAAENAGKVAAQQRQTERAQALRRAMEVIRSSLNVELVARAIVREAMRAHGVSGARLCMMEHGQLGAATYRYDPLQDDVLVEYERPAAEVLSLLQRALGDRTLLVVDQSDALSRFALDTLHAQRAYLAALENEQVRFGVLLLTLDDQEEAEPDIERWIAIFAEQATVAAAQASLFVELGNKNAELLRANETLEHRGEVIRDLVYALSHDLRTPLAAAAMTTQQALDGMYGPLPDAYRDILQRSLASNDELRRLAETLLMVARYESGDQSLVREPVDLGRVAQSIVTELEPLWRGKHIHLSVEKDDAAVVLGDESELRRAVMNLLANALHWTPDGGSITVSTRCEGAAALLQISDTGYGVPESQRARLFERLTPDVARQGYGSGLGLYIVRRIAESHGGSVHYEPREPRGSAFTLALPLEPVTERAGSARTTRPKDEYVPHRSG
ncbi:MAG TPA: HAMP domain-containing sensor histidine kinase [Candidatus Eremiobacteraceae bacterium]|nr:HAMP domain-containing sensor histidine kinase [Candidatus Eremiobacteraceae bacterium]